MSSWTAVEFAPVCESFVAVALNVAVPLTASRLVTSNKILALSNAASSTSTSNTSSALI